MLLIQVDDNWVDEYGGDGFSNPFKFKMFLGRDEKGDFLPARALREKYSQERRDVFPEDDEESEDEEENAQPNIRKGEQGGFNNDADMLNRLFGRSDENTPEDGRPWLLNRMQFFIYKEEGKIWLGMLSILYIRSLSSDFLAMAVPCNKI